MRLVVCLIILFVFAVALITRHLRSSPVMFFSCRSLPLQQQRRGRVDDIEFNLMQHPLALFPHLEESLPPDVSCHRLGLVAKLVFFGLNVVHLTVNWYSSNLFVF